MDECKPFGTPTKLSLKLCKDRGGKEVHSTRLPTKGSLCQKQEKPHPSLSFLCLYVATREGHGDMKKWILSTFSDQKQVISSVMYLTSLRPDVTYLVSSVSRYMEKPTEMHINAARRILKYMKGIVDYGVFYKGQIVLVLLGTPTVTL